MKENIWIILFIEIFCIQSTTTKILNFLILIFDSVRIKLNISIKTSLIMFSATESASLF